MKKNNLYIYIDQPFANQQMEMVFPKKFKNPKFNLKFLSTQNISFTKDEIRNYYKSTPSNEIPKNVIYLNSQNEFENYVKKIKSEDLVFLRERSINEIKFNNFDLKLFKKYKIKTIWFDYDPWFKSNLSKSTFLNTLRHIRVATRKLILSMKKYDYEPNYYVGFGTETKKNFIKMGFKKTKYLDCPSIWIKSSKKKPRIKNFIVYVDENLFFSRDQFLFDKKMKKISNVNTFLKDINLFFNILEKKYKTKVIISCSKKYTYDKNYFEGRKIIYGKTLDLISRSKAVVGHSSDALFQAIYSNKPTILLKHKTFNVKKNFFVHFKSINLFDKYANYLEDYLKNKKKINISINKKYYKSILTKYFISKKFKLKNFYENFSKQILQ